MEVVHKLEKHISGLKTARYQPPKSKGVDMNRGLYRQSNRVSIRDHCEIEMLDQSKDKPLFLN